MDNKLSQKEKMMLEDQKNHETICIEKYSHYGREAEDQQLKDLCEKHEQHERQHLDTINQLLGGTVPQMNQQQKRQQNKSQAALKQPAKKNNSKVDKTICNDLLMSEKYVSSTYNTAIFEFRDPNIRQILNHIQKEEQEHGEDLSTYMISNGMYKVK